MQMSGGKQAIRFASLPQPEPGWFRPNRKSFHPPTCDDSVKRSKITQFICIHANFHHFICMCDLFLFSDSHRNPPALKVMNFPSIFRHFHPERTISTGRVGIQMSGSFAYSCVFPPFIRRTFPPFVAARESGNQNVFLFPSYKTCQLIMNNKTQQDLLLASSSFRGKKIRKNSGKI
jgi:hypothetical protein